MGLTNIYVVLGQKVGIDDHFSDEEKERLEEYDCCVDEQGQLFEIPIKLTFKKDTSNPTRPLTPGQRIDTIMVLDYAPYEDALGDEIILGVELHSGGDGYADITHLLDTSREQIKEWTERVTELLRTRGLPHDKVRVWIVSTPDQ